MADDDNDSEQFVASLQEKQPCSERVDDDDSDWIFALAFIELALM